MQTWKLNESLAHLTAALELNPKYLDAIITLGRVLARMGRGEEATGAFQKVIGLAPTHADAHYELARQLLTAGKIKEAIARLSEAIRHNPNHADAHRHLGLALLAEGKPQLALPQFRAVLKEKKEDAQGHFELARALKLLNRHEDAIASYREALRLRPDWPEASNDLAWLLATAPEDNLRDGALARNIAERALEISRRREPMLLDTVAAAQAEAGNFEDAIVTEKRAIELAKAIQDEKLVGLLEGHLAGFQRKQPVRLELRK
jgi:tetratricopeptide (TPR) repeat protein